MVESNMSGHLNIETSDIPIDQLAINTIRTFNYSSIQIIPVPKCWYCIIINTINTFSDFLW